MNEIRVLFVAPEKEPCVKDVSVALEALQKEVGGYIQAIYPFEDQVALLCNEEGKLLGLPLNRVLRDRDGEIYDIISGNFLIVGLGDEQFESLTEDQINKYSSLYAVPEKFIRKDGKIVVFPLTM